MRARFIKVGIRERMMVRTNNTAALCHVADTLKGAGFVEVGLIRFWLHVVRPRRVNTYEPKVKIKASK